MSQNLVMTPQLQQAIKLLQLNHMELAEMVNQELVENPVLEEIQDSEGGAPEVGDTPDLTQTDNNNPEFEQSRDEAAAADQQLQPATESLTNNKEEFDWEAYLEDYNNTLSSAPSMREVSTEDNPSYENILTKSTTLEEHLHWQLSMIQLMDNEEKFAMLVISNLADDGYFGGNLEDLAKEAAIDPEDAEEILKIIQSFDPVGVGSRNLQECLLIQAKILDPRQPLIEDIITHHMGEMEKRNLPAIAKALNTTLEKVIEAHKIITEFEPRPGSLFTTPDPQYITPDIYIVKIGNDFVISMNEEGLPRLRVSPYYRDVLSKQKLENTEKSKATKEYVQEKLKSAMWLIRSIQNRQKTIHKVTEAILARQKDFFEKGVQHLKPMVLKDIAADVGMHESTISRVTTNKYMHTPVGTFELKYFFNSSIGTSDGGDAFASSAVKDKIKQLISHEDPKRPLSDQELVELLKKENVDIARRTVAKYREMLNILSSSKRKKLF